ncbi:MAG TPA: LytR C-terminal domain-containing protein, partial [Chloroflexota bacterium]|nr:LytR C-terminal domain-containing protein [Chloroflexota bacterium]
GWSADGQSILLPATADGIPALVRRLTHDPVLAGRGAAVTVWNGSGITGLAVDVGSTLHRDGVAVTAAGSTPHAGRTRTVVVRNTLVAGANDAAIQVLARMLQAPVLARPEHGAHTPIVILLGSDVPTAQ